MDNVQKKVLIFSAPWCKACGPYKQALTKADIEFTEYNYENVPELVEKYGVKGLPTTVILKGKEIIATIVQAVPAEVIKEVLAS